MMKIQKIQGFTLIELTLVLGMLSIIIGSVVFIINPVAQFQKARDAKRKNDLAQIQKALETYYNDYRSYPPSLSFQINGINWGTSWTPYMQILPKDPSLGRNYLYVAPGSLQSYQLYVSLERGVNDSQACNDGANPPNDKSCPGVPPAVFCGGSNICDYGVSSSNVSP